MRRKYDLTHEPFEILRNGIVTSHDTIPVFNIGIRRVLHVNEKKFYI